MTSTDPMKPETRRRNRNLVTMMFVLSAIFFFGGGWLIQSKLKKPRERMAERKQLVLYDADHKAIAKACKYLFDHRSEIAVEPPVGQKQTGEMDVLHLTDETMPVAIWKLVPSYVLASPDEIRIEMGDEIYHYGLSYSPALTKYSLRKVEENLYFYTQDGVMPDRIR